MIGLGIIVIVVIIIAIVLGVLYYNRKNKDF